MISIPSIVAAPTGTALAVPPNVARGTVAGRATGVVAPTPSPTLTITGTLSFFAGAAQGTVIGLIGNVPAGSTPTITPNDGRLVVGGSAGNWTVNVGATAASAGTINLSVAAAGATGASAAVTVNAADAGYEVILLFGQSDMAARGSRDPAIDTENARVKQFPSIVADPATYRTIRDSIYPLYHPEDHRTAGEAGPGQALGKQIAAGLPANRMVLLVPCAWGATGLVAGNAEWSIGGSLYEAAIAQTNAAIAAAKALYPSSRFHSAHFIQGNNDGSTPQVVYEGALEPMFADLRSRVTGASTATPIVMGSMLPIAIETQPNKQNIEAAQMAVAARGTNIFYVPGPYGSVDPAEAPVYTHYAATGARTLGVAMGNVALGTRYVSFGRATVEKGEGNTGPTIFTHLVYRTDSVGAATSNISFLPGTTSPEDFTGAAYPVPAPVSWAPGQNVTSISISVNGGTNLEPDEAYVLGLTAPTGYSIGTRPTSTGSILNDDADQSGAVDADGYPSVGMLQNADLSKPNAMFKDAERTQPAVAGDIVLAIGDATGGGRTGVTVGSPVAATVNGQLHLALNSTSQYVRFDGLVAFMSTDAAFTVHDFGVLGVEGNISRTIWSLGAGTNRSQRRNFMSCDSAGTARYIERAASGTVLDQPTFPAIPKGVPVGVSFRRKADGWTTIVVNGTVVLDQLVAKAALSNIVSFVWGARLASGEYSEFTLGTKKQLLTYSVAQGDNDLLVANNRGVARMAA